MRYISPGKISPAMDSKTRYKCSLSNVYLLELQCINCIYVC
uniref:Uncharacterized protein n=1 Tax=Rhizophora mucronata TaxID=61149 RepID=A0A2P2QUZ8_RHIMU